VTGRGLGRLAFGVLVAVMAAAAGVVGNAAAGQQHWPGVLDLARRHPWPAVGILVGVGVVVEVVLWLRPRNKSAQAPPSETGTRTGVRNVPPRAVAFTVWDQLNRRSGETLPTPPPPSGHAAAPPTVPARSDTRSDEQADPLHGLASMVRQTWEREERQRGLLYPNPLPLSWRTVGPPLGDNWSNVRRDGLDQALDLSGTYEQLYDVLVNERHHGRIVLLGRPGAGKTALLLHLTLRALDDGSAGSRMPVLLRLSTWDPHEQSFEQWIQHRLAEDYGWGSRPTPDGPALPVNRLLPILDGFDEMTAHRRRDALVAINRAQHRVSPLVLSSRTDEYVDAINTVDGAVLSRAAVLELKPLDAATESPTLITTRTRPSCWTCPRPRRLRSTCSTSSSLPSTRIRRNLGSDRGRGAAATPSGG
jgi:NACHT domain